MPLPFRRPHPKPNPKPNPIPKANVSDGNKEHGNNEATYAAIATKQRTARSSIATEPVAVAGNLVPMYIPNTNTTPGVNNPAFFSGSTSAIASRKNAKGRGRGRRKIQQVTGTLPIMKERGPLPAMMPPILNPTAQPQPLPKLADNMNFMTTVNPVHDARSKSKVKKGKSTSGAVPVSRDHKVYSTGSATSKIQGMGPLRQEKPKPMQLNTHVSRKDSPMLMPEEKPTFTTHGMMAYKEVMKCVEKKMNAREKIEAGDTSNGNTTAGYNEFYFEKDKEKQSFVHNDIASMSNDLPTYKGTMKEGTSSVEGKEMINMSAKAMSSALEKMQRNRHERSTSIGAIPLPRLPQASVKKAPLIGPHHKTPRTMTKQESSKKVLNQHQKISKPENKCETNSSFGSQMPLLCKRQAIEAMPSILVPRLRELSKAAPPNPYPKVPNPLKAHVHSAPMIPPVLPRKKETPKTHSFNENPRCPQSSPLLSNLQEPINSVQNITQGTFQAQVDSMPTKSGPAPSRLRVPNTSDYIPGPSTLPSTEASHKAQKAPHTNITIMTSPENSVEDALKPKVRKRIRMKAKSTTKLVTIDMDLKKQSEQRADVASAIEAASAMVVMKGNIPIPMKKNPLKIEGSTEKQYTALEGKPLSYETSKIAQLKKKEIFHHSNQPIKNQRDNEKIEQLKVQVLQKKSQPQEVNMEKLPPDFDAMEKQYKQHPMDHFCHWPGKGGIEDEYIRTRNLKNANRTEEKLAKGLNLAHGENVTILGDQEPKLKLEKVFDTNKVISVEETPIHPSKKINTPRKGKGVKCKSAIPKSTPKVLNKISTLDIISGTNQNQREDFTRNELDQAPKYQKRKPKLFQEKVYIKKSPLLGNKKNLIAGGNNNNENKKKTEFRTQSMGVMVPFTLEEAVVRAAAVVAAELRGGSWACFDLPDNSEENSAGNDRDRAIKIPSSISAAFPGSHGSEQPPHHLLSSVDRHNMDLAFGQAYPNPPLLRERMSQPHAVERSRKPQHPNHGCPPTSFLHEYQQELPPMGTGAPSVFGHHPVRQAMEGSIPRGKIDDCEAPGVTPQNYRLQRGREHAFGSAQHKRLDKQPHQQNQQQPNFFSSDNHGVTAGPKSIPQVHDPVHSSKVINSNALELNPRPSKKPKASTKSTKTTGKNYDCLSSLYISAASIEQFALEKILPSILSSGLQDYDNGPNRAFIATLVHLREVLVTNADSIFFNGKLNDRIANPDEYELSASSAKYTRKNTGQDYMKEQKAFVSKTFATGLVYSAIHRLRPRNDALLLDFTKAIDSFDSCDEEFTSCLGKADASMSGIMPNGKVLGKEENLAWRVSYNRARDEHPLIRKPQMAREQPNPSPTSLPTVYSHSQPLLPQQSSVHQLHVPPLMVPDPNACALYMVQKIPFQVMKEKEVMEREQKRVQRESNVIRDCEERLRTLESKFHDQVSSSPWLKSAAGQHSSSSLGRKKNATKQQPPDRYGGNRKENEDN